MIIVIMIIITEEGGDDDKLVTIDGDMIARLFL